MKWSKSVEKRNERVFQLFVFFSGFLLASIINLFRAETHGQHELGLLILSQLLPLLHLWRFKYVRGDKWVTYSGRLLYLFHLSFFFLAASLIIIAYESKYPNYFNYCLLLWFITLENEILSRSPTAFDLEKQRTKK